jgi:sigma-B regulation protein RsbU (phosphoserine phosphatase)
MPLASLFLAKLDPKTGVVNYCSAGHPPALLLRANGELERLSEGGMLLGVVPSAPYVCGSFQLGAGDVLMVYSDGITESADCAGEEFGETRLEAELRRAAGRTGDAMLFSVLGAVQDFAAACPLVDDMSLAIVRPC